MRGIKVFFLLVCFGFISTGFVQAQSLEGKKVAYIDLSRIFDEYEKTKEYDKILEGRHREYENERNEKLEKIRELQNKLSLLKEEEKSKIQGDLEGKRTELLEFDRQKQMDLRKQREEKIREILLEIEKVVRDFAEKEKFVLVLNDRVLIYGSDEFDITGQILKILNSSQKK